MAIADGWAGWLWRVSEVMMVVSRETKREPGCCLKWTVGEGNAVAGGVRVIDSRTRRVDRRLSFAKPPSCRPCVPSEPASTCLDPTDTCIPQSENNTSLPQLPNCHPKACTIQASRLIPRALRSCLSIPFLTPIHRSASHATAATAKSAPARFSNSTGAASGCTLRSMASRRRTSRAGRRVQRW